MKDFIAAALPWVLCALAVALLCARLGKAGGQSRRLDQSMATGAALGLALGPLWGMALASLLPERGEGNDSGTDSGHEKSR